MGYRDGCVAYLRLKESEFHWFVDEDEAESFTAYCDSMAKNKAWGGNLEIVAMSKELTINVVVHQPGAPRFTVNYDGGKAKRTIHISYHEGEHYASVRCLDDNEDAPAKPIMIVDAGAAKKPGDKAWAVEDTISQSTGCKNMDHIREVLGWNDGDAEATVEFLLMELTDNGPEFWDVLAASKEASPNPQSEEKTQDPSQRPSSESSPDKSPP